MQVILLVDLTKINYGQRISLPNMEGRPTRCQLCHIHAETALHVMVRCPYSQHVWRRLQDWLGIALHAPPTNSYRKLKPWWNSMLMTQAPGAPDKAQKDVAECSTTKG
jgi:hypothetical protein